MNWTLNRRALLGAAASAFAAPAIARGNARPNILFIMADDLGYADLSCYGRRDYRTPELDKLASAGMRFTSAYANSPVCSATRTALITGRYQYRLPIGLEEPLALRDVGLPPNEPTLPSLLRSAGYATSLIGKWHLGASPRYGPLLSGNDYFYGIEGGGADYFTHRSAKGGDLWEDRSPVTENGYLTDLLADRAIARLGRSS
jgi:arylsulfatase A-like enzyme